MGNIIKSQLNLRFGHLKYEKHYHVLISNFCYKYGITFAPSTEYVKGNYSKKRFALVSMPRIISLVMGIRWAISAISNRLVIYTHLQNGLQNPNYKFILVTLQGNFWNLGHINLNIVFIYYLFNMAKISEITLQGNQDEFIIWILQTISQMCVWIGNTLIIYFL